MLPTNSNPLRQLFEEWLVPCDFAVLHHGFEPHGRDYSLVLQIPTVFKGPGTYKLTFTHVPDLKYETRVSDDSWQGSWEDTFIDYQVWTDAGEPSGYVWGTNWSDGYPGLSIVENSPNAERWSKRIGKPYFEAELKTDRFQISIIYHDVHGKRLSDDASLMDRVVVPVK